MDKELELKSLIQMTNDRLGFSPKTPSELNHLSLSIKKKTGSTISLSSLKRIWGYVDYSSFPSPNTLNILSRFNDFDDWEDFLRNKDLPRPEPTSEFLAGSVVDAESLITGDVLIIDWEENKSCELEYLGGHRFVVICSRNIKLIVNDTFTLHSVCVGLPFYAADIHRNSDTIPGYIGAKNGITAIRLKTGNAIHL